MGFNDLINEFGLQKYTSGLNAKPVLKVNTHIHTPFSFSAFASIEQATNMAKQENIKILGINDFYTTDGYDEFYHSCRSNKIYPLFNIEFMGLIKEYQSKNIRVNDPNNPGRIYFCGKGLKYPFQINEKLWKKILKLQEESINQVKQMIEKANNFFSENQIDLNLDFEKIKNKYAKKLIRERHIAKALRIILNEKYQDSEKRKKILKTIYSGKESKIDIKDNNALENEIRSNLLKSGGPAYVTEDENAFLSVSEIIEIIINAGGIPCYPVLLDDTKGNYTEFEEDYENLHKKLSDLNIRCIELIPGRNNLDYLEKFVRFFDVKNYIILFGTEHNTPNLIPLTVSCRNNAPLTNELLKISFEGACVIAAHQFLIANGKEGYISNDGKSKFEEKKEFIQFGKTVLNNFFN